MHLRQALQTRLDEISSKSFFSSRSRHSSVAVVELISLRMLCSMMIGSAISEKRVMLLSVFLLRAKA